MRAVLHATHEAVRRLVPAGIRPMLRDAATALLVPSATRPGPQPAGRITVAGLLTSQSGLGETARLSARALAELGWRVGQIDLTASLRVPHDAAGAGDHPCLVEGDGGGPILVHLNPPNFQSALVLRAVPRRGRKLIAYWVWELPIVPPTWQRAFRLANEIWVPTRFVADALHASGCRTPVRVIPYPVRIPASRVGTGPGDTTALRVLTVFAYDSGFERKNPLASVAAFRQAFGNRADVELVVKARGRSSTGEPERRFAAAIAGMDNVKVLAGAMARDQYLDLLATSDVVMSLHRSEGFGLVLAEAMLMGKPVICTAWSGNLDFMTGESACLVPATLIPASDESAAYRNLRANWADPSVAEAASWLLRLEDSHVRRTIGDAAKRHATECLSLARFGATIAEALGAAAAPCQTRSG
jgi:glycosyltransferase involved in cell wall biosynthesis